MYHNTFVTATRKGEFQPGCCCHWNAMPCTSRQHANQWVQAHLEHARNSHLMPYVYTDKLDTAS